MTVLHARDVSSGAGEAGGFLRTPDELSRLMRVPFSDQQLAAITAPLGPGVIVAGAGSGKTTVMAARVVWLVGTGLVRPDQVLGLTFTNKAAAELGARVRQALTDAGLLRYGFAETPGRTGFAEASSRTGFAEASARTGFAEAPDDDPGEPTVSTYHAFAGRLIAEHGLRIGAEPDTRLLADATRYQLAAQAVGGFRDSLSWVSTHLPTVIKNVLALDEQMSEHLVSPGAVRGFDDDVRRGVAAAAKKTQDITRIDEAARGRDELLQLVAAYRELKHDRAVMDFADQMALGAAIAEQSAQAGDIERDRYRVVLLDEYQDTSVAQRRMLAGLFSGASVDDGRGHPVTAVGDPCQAIYGWRGASVANLDEFPVHFPGADGAAAPRFALSVNRRCGARILRAGNEQASELHAVHQGVRPLSVPDDAPAGEVRVALLETHREEMEWAAAEVERVKSADRRLRWSDIGILVRTNTDVGQLQAHLRRHGVPVEVVGLGGLLSRPEVADVVATLEVMHELTANAAMLRLLTGPRWRIGPRDLALLAQRAKQLAHADHAEVGEDLAAALEEAVAGVDLTEIVSLADALDDPGAAPYSPQARERFTLLAREIRQLRRHVGEPLVDLVRRVIDTVGLDVELAASSSAVAAQARDNLATFVDAVASYAGVDTEASLSGLLAYLAAEDDYAQGLAVAAPTESDSVKLMTVHKAKGLEWEVVFVPALADGVFPSTQGRSRWPKAAKELPWPLRGDAESLPELSEWTNKALKAFEEEAKGHEALEERRLGYVAFTRARRLLVASGHWWGPTQKKRRGPSDYLRRLCDRVREAGGEPLTWAPEPPDDAENPQLAEQRELAWPADLDARELAARAEGAQLVRHAQAAAAAGEGYAPDDETAQLMLDEQARVQEWDAEIDRLLAEAQAAQVREHEIELPPTLSATALLRLHTDPEGLARDLARPMPRQPSAAARFGTRFHAWVESYFGQQRLLDPAEIPGAADDGIADDAELQSLIAAFRSGPYAEQPPHAVEAPFALVLADQVVRGRIDAVYATADGFEVVDWKTNQQQTADPLQLAIYRLAWADLAGVPLEQVSAAFYYVRSGEIVRPDHVAGPEELAQLLALDRGATP